MSKIVSSGARRCVDECSGRGGKHYHIELVIEERYATMKEDVLEF